MAIFASRYERKLPIDDTEAISCEITTVEQVDGHTVSVYDSSENLYPPTEKSIMSDAAAAVAADLLMTVSDSLLCV